MRLLTLFAMVVAFWVIDEAAGSHVRGGALWNTPVTEAKVTFDGWWAERQDAWSVNVGDIVVSSGSRDVPKLVFGDGTFTEVELHVIDVKPGSQGNYWVAEIRAPGGGELTHTYSQIGEKVTNTVPAKILEPWTAYLEYCCRLAKWSNGNQDLHVNNADSSIRITSQIDLESKMPGPEVSALPLVDCYIGKVCTSTVGSTPSASWQLPSTGVAAPGAFFPPGPIFGGVSSPKISGDEWSWNTLNSERTVAGLAFYSTHHVASNGAHATSAVEFMVRLIPEPGKEKQVTIAYVEPDSNCRNVPWGTRNLDGPPPAHIASTPPPPPWLPYTVYTYPKHPVQLVAVAEPLQEWANIQTMWVSGPGALVASHDAPRAPGDIGTITVAWDPGLDDVGVHGFRYFASGDDDGYALECLGRVEVLPVLVAPRIEPEWLGNETHGDLFRFVEVGEHSAIAGRALSWNWTVDGADSGTGQATNRLLGPGTHLVCVTVTYTLNALILDGVACAEVEVKTKISDNDRDGVANDSDNCPETPNRDQEDTDFDGFGDACDEGPAEPTENPRVAPAFDDGDGISPRVDNCPTVWNLGQEDLDNDGAGDACDDDIDGDRVPEAGNGDNCPGVPNPDQVDLDHDKIGDACDPDVNVEVVAPEPPPRTTRPPPPSPAQRPQLWLGSAVLVFVGLAATVFMVATLRR